MKSNKLFIINKFAAVLLVFSIIAAATGCNKILDLTSPNVVGDNDVFTSVDGLRNARTGMYHTLQDRNYYGGYFPLTAECYTDNGTTGGYDVPDLNELSNRKVTTVNIYVSQNYNAVYKSIYSANKIIENIDIVPGLDKEEHDNTLGEALFVRAMAHFDLLRTWGEHWDKSSTYGVSIVTSTANPSKPVPRSTVEQSYQQIFSDLNQAYSLLNTDDGNAYISPAAAEALLARVNLFYGNMSAAADKATSVIDNNNYALFSQTDFTKIYTERLTKESVLELKFDQANSSSYNGITYLRDNALRVDVLFLARTELNTFFNDRPADARSVLLDFAHNDVSIEPDGRTQKYRGEITKDNSAYLMRLAEMYLIRGEANGRINGLPDLNKIRTARGLNALSSGDVPTDAAYLTAILDERRAELNFEGHRLSDLARTGKVEEYLGVGVLPIMPIPQREIAATNGVVKQNPGY